jgi:hypothetical protein
MPQVAHLAERFQVLTFDNRRIVTVERPVELV